MVVLWIVDALRWTTSAFQAASRRVMQRSRPNGVHSDATEHIRWRQLTGDGVCYARRINKDAIARGWAVTSEERRRFDVTRASTVSCCDGFRVFDGLDSGSTQFCCTFVAMVNDHPPGQDPRGPGARMMGCLTFNLLRRTRLIWSWTHSRTCTAGISISKRFHAVCKCTLKFLRAVWHYGWTNDLRFRLYIMPNMLRSRANRSGNSRRFIYMPYIMDVVKNI
jgi:hypothetical protein